MRTWAVFAALVLSACQGGPLTEPLAEATTPPGWEVLKGRGVRMALPPDWAGGIPDASLRRQIELAVRPGVGGLDEDVAEEALRLLREAPERLLFFAIDIREPRAAYFANVNAVDLGIAPTVPVEEVLARTGGFYRGGGFTVLRSTQATVRGRPAGRIVMEVSFPVGVVRELVYLVPTEGGYRSVTFAELATAFDDRLEHFEDAIQTVDFSA
ncbi:MAG TPA: hypothetical protein VJ868_07635 [Actinomycetota bacterium]|nr:hypothetical protein [Actinomycetota bacterium]